MNWAKFELANIGGMSRRELTMAALTVLALAGESKVAPGVAPVTVAIVRIHYRPDRWSSVSVAYRAKEGNGLRALSAD